MHPPPNVFFVVVFYMIADEYVYQQPETASIGAWASGSTSPVPAAFGYAPKPAKTKGKGKKGKRSKGVPLDIYSQQPASSTATTTAAHAAWTVAPAPTAEADAHQQQHLYDQYANDQQYYYEEEEDYYYDDYDAGYDQYDTHVKGTGSTTKAAPAGKKNNSKKNNGKANNGKANNGKAKADSKNTNKATVITTGLTTLDLSSKQPKVSARTGVPSRQVSQTPPPAVSRSQSDGTAASKASKQKFHTPQPSASASPTNPLSPGVAARPALRRTPSALIRAGKKAAKSDKLRKKYIDEDNKASSKSHLNMLIMGHVDAGKSTLMGHMLVKTGNVDNRTLHKYQRESKEMGKGSFAFAWVLDSHEDERTRGVTVDVAVNHFDTPTKHVTLLDAPGHRAFVSNMISGAAQADVAVLVVPAPENEFDSAFAEHGQTREHAILARSLGVNQLIVAVNKLDLMDWSEARFKAIGERLIPFLKSTGYRESSIRMVPVSGLIGENLTEATDARLTKWYKGASLFDMIDSFSPPHRSSEKPLRMCITDVFKSIELGDAVAGKIEAGNIIIGEPVLVLPINEILTVKSIWRNKQSVKVGQAGDNVEIGIKDIADASQLAVGQYLCALHSPVPLVTKFRAQIITMDMNIPITPSCACVLFTQSASQPALVRRLVSLVDKSTGEPIRQRPKCVPSNSAAVIDIVVNTPVCMELYSTFRQLGRFTLRRGNDTIAAGIVTKLRKVYEPGAATQPDGDVAVAHTDFI
jgi:elongation factor 1 alpha-like protein